MNAYPQWLADYSATPVPLPENVPVNYVVKRLKAVSTVRDATVCAIFSFHTAGNFISVFSYIRQ